MYVRDPVFGNVHLNSTEKKIVETAPMQRLRHIKQLGFVYMVYPGGTHTRFEHSLGTMHVTKTIMNNLGAYEEEAALAGMMHDIGHAPFSHSSDPELYQYLKTQHENIGEKIIRSSEIKDIISDSGLSMGKLIKYFNGYGKGEIITGAIGSDRIDYLSRDAMHTGVAYGIIDYNRISAKFGFHKGKLAVYYEGIQGAESMLIARYFMHNSVYFHHTVRIATSMYRKALDTALEEGGLSPESLYTFTDSQMQEFLLTNKASSQLMSKVINRRLFKRAYDGAMPANLKISELESTIERTGIG
ncbi:MAG: HD domain-containing protein, partial [Candidatus Micrarchaeaceae archaeon]